MPATEVVIYAEADGSAPLLEWLDAQPAKVQDKCLVRIERLRALGHELRRPEADTLREGIHELRLSLHGVNYRVLYFFSGRRAVLSHGFTKQAATVPAREIDLALTHTARFERDPMTHTYRE